MLTSGALRLALDDLRGNLAILLLGFGRDDGGPIIGGIHALGTDCAGKKDRLVRPDLNVAFAFMPECIEDWQLARLGPALGTNSRAEHDSPRIAPDWHARVDVRARR
jgi:hypothetical protein